MKFIQFISQIFSDESGHGSSKRLVGILCSLALIFVYIHSHIKCQNLEPSENMTEILAILAFSCLGLTTIDKLKNRKTESKKTETTIPNELS